MINSHHLFKCVAINNHVNYAMITANKQKVQYALQTLQVSVSDALHFSRVSLFLERADIDVNTMNNGLMSLKRKLLFFFSCVPDERFVIFHLTGQVLQEESSL